MMKLLSTKSLSKFAIKEKNILKFTDFPLQVFCYMEERHLNWVYTCIGGYDDNVGVYTITLSPAHSSIRGKVRYIINLVSGKIKKW